MECKQSKTGDIFILKPLDKRLGFSPEMKEVFLGTIDEGYKKIIINCSAVEFFDTGFLGVVVAARKKGAEVGFCRISDALLSIFSLTGTDKVFHFFETQKEGVEFFQDRS